MVLEVSTICMYKDVGESGVAKQFRSFQIEIVMMMMYECMLSVRMYLCMYDVFMYVDMKMDQSAYDHAIVLCQLQNHRI